MLPTRKRPGHHDIEDVVSTDTLVDRVDFLRLEASRKLDPAVRSAMGQFMTPSSVSRLMASMLPSLGGIVRILDPGAGVGSLTAAVVAELCARGSRPRRIEATAIEADANLASYLEQGLAYCRKASIAAGVDFEPNLFVSDFFVEAHRLIGRDLFSREAARFDVVITNPPYRKIHSASPERAALRRLGVDTTNLYTGFLSLAVELLKPGGHLIAITPRSFCNGRYFRAFRAEFLARMVLRHIHVYERRDEAFGEDDVLQENIIFHAQRAHGSNGSKTSAAEKVTISVSHSPDDPLPESREVPYREVLDPGDPEMFIHVVSDELGAAVRRRIEAFNCTLDELDLAVSTGKVVDFRAKELLRRDPAADTVPLIYPGHLRGGKVTYPLPGNKKPNALADTAEARPLLLPAGNYVLVKRFTSKEEARRVVAVVFRPQDVPGDRVAFENHLNVFHRRDEGLPRELAEGLAAYLNSTLVDEYFRQFNGHTQVNATDLRSLRYPTVEALHRMGRKIKDGDHIQETFDQALKDELQEPDEAEQVASGADPVQARGKIDDAVAIIKALGLPKAQQNTRSALTLLSVLGLTPARRWSEASAPLMGITPMMDFFAEHYGKRYKPNTRETVRRQTVHQFVEAGILLENPDDPSRPTNSPKAVYRVAPQALDLLVTFGSADWDHRIREYLAGVVTLQERNARARKMNIIPVTLPDGTRIELSPGGQNPLIKQIIEDFAPRFTPGGRVLYVGDTGDKWSI